MSSMNMVLLFGGKNSNQLERIESVFLPQSNNLFTQDQGVHHKMKNDCYDRFSEAPKFKKLQQMSQEKGKITGPEGER